MDLSDLNLQVLEQVTDQEIMGSFQSIQQEMFLQALEIWNRDKNQISYTVESFQMQRHI